MMSDQKKGRASSLISVSKICLLEIVEKNTVRGVREDNTSVERSRKKKKTSRVETNKKMFSSTRFNLIRMPKGRRKKERAWEIINLRSLGQKEGAQNYGSWAFGAMIGSIIGGYEFYMQFKRIRARGDSCEACEASRRMYRERLKNSEMLTGGASGKLSNFQAEKASKAFL